MIRSNSKKAVENLKKYIISNYDPSNYGFPVAVDFSTVAKQIVGCFWSEVGQYSRKSYQESFVDWCGGLPSILDTCYYYNRSAVDDLGGILEETEEEKARFDEYKAAEMLSRLIWRELFKACGYQVKDFNAEQPDTIPEKFIEVISRDGSASVAG